MVLSRFACCPWFSKNITKLVTMHFTPQFGLQAMVQHRL